MSTPAPIRPCPFCKQPAPLVRVNLIYPKGKFFSFAVRCDNFKCWVRPSTYNVDKPARTKAEAIKRWGGQP